jgi:putative ATP-binding cassette transporter
VCHTTRASEVLKQAQLGHLEKRLDDVADWSHMLSLGEQQRLAFARVLLSRPRIVFLDEATSAMDEGLEDAMYRLVGQELPECMLVSVGHRSTLNAFHSHRLNLLAGARWDFHAASHA